MGLSQGTWVDVGEGRIALISSWDETSGQAEAETPAGGKIERPIAFAEARWKPLPENGLRVVAALDPDAIQARSETSPTDIVVLALNDLGGRGETTDLRRLISPLVVPEAEWKRWWRRTQVRLDDEPRVDTSKSRDKTYSLETRGGSTLGRSLVPPIRDESRRGRRTADGPQLKRARDRAQSKGPRDADDERLFETELTIAGDPTVDPTDRFMAAELGLWLDRWTSDEARAMLADDVLAVDLLRIPQHSSRARALEWALQFEGVIGVGAAGSSISFRSAGAAGSPWWNQALSALGVNGIRARDAAVGILGWSVPGDEDAGPAKLKDDIPTFERRIARAEDLLPTLSEDCRLGLWEGSIHALRTLPDSQSIYGSAIVRLSERIARLTWAVFASLDEPRRPRLRDLDPMSRDRVAAFVRSAPEDALDPIRDAVITWYSKDPKAHEASLRAVADATGKDALELGLKGARFVLGRTNLSTIARQLFRQANETKRTDPTAASIVNLAVTVVFDDPAVARALDRLAEAAAEAYVSGSAPATGPITFSRTGWERFNGLVAAQVEEATIKEAAARRMADEANAEADRLRALAEARAQTLAEARTSAGSATRQDSARLASSLLKPVALAVGDSYESNSLMSLQDRLLAVLQRAKIVQILEVGQVAAFDPSRHQWVGQGVPTDRVEARSPGFVLEGEGGDGIVLVPARVVAPATT